MLYPYTPRKEDELELIEDDFVFVSIADQGQTGELGLLLMSSPCTHTHCYMYRVSSNKSWRFL